MGAVSCKMDGAAFQNAKRFFVKEITAHIYDDEEDTSGPVVMRAELDKEGKRAPTITRPDGRPVEYVYAQDLFIPKIPHSHHVTIIKFKITMLVTPSAPIHNVTFVTGNSRREVDSFIATELVQNANIQNESNVTLLGDFVTRNDSPDVISHTFEFKVPHPRSMPVPLHFVFCEYQKASHSLEPLASGYFYLTETEIPSTGTLHLDRVMSPDATFAPIRELAISPPRDPVVVSTSQQASSQQASRESGLGPKQPHIDQFEDGPLFRSKISAMESRTAALKQSTKTILKRALVVHEQLKEAADAIRWFTSGLSNAAKSDIPTLQVLMPLFNDHSQGLPAARNLMLTVCAEFAALVITPLKNLYDYDVKPLELRKREFEEESSQYYSWMSRYLSTKRDRRDKTVENDAKYLDKRLSFETSRFDYYNALLDVHGGKKMQQLAFQVALFTQRWRELTTGNSELHNNVKSPVANLVDELRQASKDWARYDQEREDRRRHLERFLESSTMPFPDQTLDDNDIDKMEAVQDEAAAHKEGLLWALSRPGGIAEAQNLSKQGIKWHKYWVVQDGGKLWEYANWKQGMDLHNEPIDLKVARVREANPADRRFCFEIVTPNYKRVYQATSDEDLKSWITYINRGISSSLENFNSDSPMVMSMASTQELSIVKPRDTIEKLGENIGRKLSLKTGSRRNNTPSSGAFGSPPGDRSAFSTPTQTQLPNPQLSKSALVLLSSLQKIPSNRQCAECETTKNVEWVSINLLVLLCISCSGSHRSLGSHISKVRSLTLDTVSFTKDLVEALKGVSNAKLNGVWESRLHQKPAITDRNRLQFVTEKYVEKAFITEIDKPNAFLRRAISEQDVIKVCAALAARANPNAASDDGEPLVVYALRCTPPEVDNFMVAEVLIVNGATIPETIPHGLGSAAKKYLEQRSRI